MYEIFVKLLKEHGTTAAQVAKDTGISQSTLSEWKHGNYQPKADKIKKIADYFGVSVAYLMGENKETDGNAIFLSNKKIRMVPLYESVSAGFGVLANDMIVYYIPLFISSDIETSETLCIKVQGNSMYPKIEDGDIVQVQKVASVDSGKIAVVLIDDDDGLVKRVVYGPDWIELQSINPEYQTRRFEGADIQRIRVVGLVKRIIKEC